MKCWRGVKFAGDAAVEASRGDLVIENTQMDRH